MKRPPVTCRIVTFIAATLLLALIRIAHADDASDRAAAEDLLASGSWKITYEKGWSVIRIFDKDGSFATPGRPDESGHWKIAGNKVVQTFADGRQDILMLPLDAKSVAGLARDGETVTAVHDNSAPPPVAAPMAEMTDDQRVATEALLVSGPWKIKAAGWSNIRIFDKDGTFATVTRADLHGRWKISKGVITLDFADGHKDVITLPLNANGTPGAAENGEPYNAVLLLPTAANNTPAPVPQTPLTGADANAADDLSKTLVKFPYTWEHDTVHYNITFRADGTGTAQKGDFKWHTIGALEVEIIALSKSGEPSGSTAKITFSQDYTTYSGTLYGGKPAIIEIKGHQVTSASDGGAASKSNGGKSYFGTQ